MQEKFLIDRKTKRRQSIPARGFHVIAVSFIPFFVHLRLPLHVRIDQTFGVEGVRLCQQGTHDMYVDPATRVVGRVIVNDIRVVMVTEVGRSASRGSRGREGEPSLVGGVVWHDLKSPVVDSNRLAMTNAPECVCELRGVVLREVLLLARVRMLVCEPAADIVDVEGVVRETIWREQEVRGTLTGARCGAGSSECIRMPN